MYLQNYESIHSNPLSIAILCLGKATQIRLAVSLFRHPSTFILSASPNLSVPPASKVVCTRSKIHTNLAHLSRAGRVSRSFRHVLLISTSVRFFCPLGPKFFLAFVGHTWTKQKVHTQRNKLHLPLHDSILICHVVRACCTNCTIATCSVVHALCVLPDSSDSSSLHARVWCCLGWTSHNHN